METGKNKRNRLFIRPSMLFITHRLKAYFLKIRQVAFVYINALLQACLEVAVHAPP